MAIILPFLFLVTYFVQKYYLLTSRQLRFLDLEAKRPLYSHFLEVVEGLASVRSFGWQQAAREGNLSRLDASQQPIYLLLCVQRWLNLVLDLVVAGLATIVVALAVSLRASTTGALLGIALNNVLLFGTTFSGSSRLGQRSRRLLGLLQEF